MFSLSEDVNKQWETKKNCNPLAYKRIWSQRQVNVDKVSFPGMSTGRGPSPSSYAKFVCTLYKYVYSPLGAPKCTKTNSVWGQRAFYCHSTCSKFTYSTSKRRTCGAVLVPVTSEFDTICRNSKFAVRFSTLALRALAWGLLEENKETISIILPEGNQSNNQNSTTWVEVLYDGFDPLIMQLIFVRIAVFHFDEK